MAPEHMFYGFDIKSHNANAEQIEKIIQRREAELNTPQPSRSRKQKLVKRLGGTPAISYKVFSPSETTAATSKQDANNTHKSPRLSLVTKNDT